MCVQRETLLNVAVIRSNSVPIHTAAPLRHILVSSELKGIADSIALQIGATSVETRADRIAFRIGDREYTVRIDPDFLTAYPGEEALNRISQWNVADELCRAEGLHFILTPAGLRLASSN